MATTNLHCSLQRARTIAGDNLAVVDVDTRLTYSQLDARVGGLDAGLRALHVGKGDVVGVLALNSHEHLTCWFAIPRGGAILNDLNYRLAPAELAFIIDDSRTVALVVDDAHLDAGRELRERCAPLEHLIYAGRGPVPDDTIGFERLVATRPAAPAAVDRDHIAGIFYTGGTTGLPKGAMLTHGNLVANAKHMLIGLGYEPTDRYLHAGPMFHLADGATTYALTWVGGTHVIVPAFDPEAVAATVEREAVTTVTLVPTMINLLVSHPAAAEHDLSTLRRVLYGGSPMATDVQRRALEAIPCEWVQAYGMTEAAPIVTLTTGLDVAAGVAGAEPAASLLRSAGRPVVGVEVEVRRADGTPCEPGEPGEICVRGDNVMAGYWNRPEETAAALDADGWYHSGDAGYVDPDGFLFIVDRVKDMIISGGENVYCTEVENALFSHPDVLEAAVFGVPDARWGERVHAAIVPVAGAQPSERELTQHCRRQIAAYKVPRSYEFHAQALPKSGAGKVLKRALREPHWADRELRVA